MNYKEVLATNNPSWEEEAEEFAKARTAFVLVGWSYSFDQHICVEIAKKHCYRSLAS